MSTGTKEWVEERKNEQRNERMRKGTKDWMSKQNMNSLRLKPFTAQHSKSTPKAKLQAMRNADFVIYFYWRGHWGELVLLIPRLRRGFQWRDWKSLRWCSYSFACLSQFARSPGMRGRGREERRRGWRERNVTREITKVKPSVSCDPRPCFQTSGKSIHPHHHQNSSSSS